MSDFERGNCLLARDGRKCVQELLETVIPFQVVDQVPEWYSSADEHGRTAEDLRITVDHCKSTRHVESLDRFYRCIRLEA